MTHNLQSVRELDHWAGELACPVCLGALRIDVAAVVCTECKRSYPVVDGVPVLISDRADSRDTQP
jgi:uncharacterized protein YbaR (Trm112 family)